MKKPYTIPCVETVALQPKMDILLLSDAEIDAGDLIEPDTDVSINIDSLFN